MNFTVHCIYLLILPLAAMVIALPANFYLDRNVHERQKRDAVETSFCKQEIEKNGMSLLNVGIHNLTMGTVNPKGDFFGSLKSVYHIIQADRNAAKRIIGEGLERSFINSYNSLNTKAKNVNNLESALVYMYTENHIYEYLNAALRQHDCTKKNLEPKENDIAEYATALLATLLYWQNLPEYSGTTYRVIGNVSNIDQALAKYKVGSSIVFPAFTSSSRGPLLRFGTSNEFILLEIDNSQHSFWNPNDIADLSALNDEEELLYPCLAEFKVMSRPVKKQYKDKYYHTIQLQLVGNGHSLSDDAVPIGRSGQLHFFPILLALIYSIS